MEYTIIDQDTIGATEIAGREINLKYYKARLESIKRILDEMPALKTEPDEETLRVYNENAEEIRADAESLIEDARVLLKELKDIYDAGQLPEKYVDPLTQFNDYIKQF
jgi:hypothetical protein